MVLTLDVLIDVGAIEVHVAKISGAVPNRLIAEVRRRGIAALATSRHGFCLHTIAEFDDGDEAVAAGAVHLSRSRVRARAERRERSPPRRRERNRNAWFRIVELLNDVAVDALIAVDVAPRRLPRPEVVRELVGRGAKGVDELIRRGAL